MLSSAPTACDICDKKVANKGSLARHIGESHLTATKLYEDEFCEEHRAQVSNDLTSWISPSAKRGKDLIEVVRIR